MDKLQPGQMLGAYRIINQIGQGGMAAVYKAYQPSMDRNVAIKVLPSQLAESKEFAARFQQEARIIARLEHPHILPVFDYGESDGVTYFVMRYLEAGSLKTKMEAGPLSWNEIDRIFTQLAEALSYAHSHGIVHRDLKPANALVDEEGNLFLTDFGIAKLLESASPRLTQTDAIMGTPAYISPEQAKAQTVDQRSDIYSLGIILYEMVTGRVPFVADTPLAVILKHISDPLPLPSIVKSDIPEAIERVILKALAKEPNDRYATAAEFLSAWKRALEEKETVRRAPERISTHEPRCKFCNAPFQGVGSVLVRAVYGKKQSSLNPRFCSVCEDFAHKFPGGAEVEMSMLFADVRGSTALSEQMSPMEFSQLINRFYVNSTNAIIEEDGLVEKLAGDAVAAFWGAGFAGPNYVQRTLKVAQNMSKMMASQKIPVGIGVHAGVAYFGSMGTADGLVDIAAIGDEVNLAARLASKAAAGEIIVSEKALKEAGSDGSAMESRNLELKGISEPVLVRVMSG